MAATFSPRGRFALSDQTGIVHTDMEVGSRIKEAREALGMTQVELAERVDVAQATVARWETDTRRPSYVLLQRIASATDKTVGWFFDGNEDAA